jgi:hypothetical protein
MKSRTCQELVDRLPDWATGRLNDDEGALVAAHVAVCDECSAEADVLHALFHARPEAPAGLAERIARAASVQAEAVPEGVAKRTWRRPAWALSAAAVLVLAVGATLLLRDPQGIEVDSVLEGISFDESQVWIVDDGAVAGAPVLDDLSDEALAALLKELGV